VRRRNLRWRLERKCPLFAELLLYREAVEQWPSYYYPQGGQVIAPLDLRSLSLQQFRDLVECQPVWSGGTQLLHGPLERLPVRSVIEAGGASRMRHPRLALKGLGWRTSWTTYHRKRGGGLRQSENQCLGCSWGLALQVAFARPGSKTSADASAIVEAAWRSMQRDEEP